MSCTNCGDSPVNLSCDGNPCALAPGNTAACESLPSQIQNFALQFFGEVVKTEVDGVVSWSLPCGLDVGLPANPRGLDEGLACYFLRLFNDGIAGLTGPQGPTGAAGTDGRNAYSVTTASFTQPTMGAPNVEIFTAYTPALREGMYVFVTGSGWYIINSTDGAGVLFAALVKEVSGASGAMSAGRLVIPSGVPGASVTGPQGAVGPQGPTGPAGASLTANCGYIAGTVGTDYSVPLTYTRVDFVNFKPEFLATVPGKYHVTFIVTALPQAGVAALEYLSLKIRNVSTSSDVLYSEVKRAGWIQDQVIPITLNALVTTDAANQTVGLYAACTTGDVIKLKAVATSVTFVRVQ